MPVIGHAFVGLATAIQYEPHSRRNGRPLSPIAVALWVPAVVAVLFAVPMGVLSAWKARTLVDRLVMGFSVLGFAVPVFLVGYLLIYFFAIKLQWLPVQGYRPISEGIGQTARSIVLPAFALGMVYMALIARVTRASMLDVLSQDYIRTARAKGVANRPVVWKHALKNAAIPIVTIVGIELGTLLGGSVITETIFAWPGVGRLSVQAIYNRDYPVVQAAVFTLSATFVLVNLIVDVLYTYLDPRIRLS